MTGPSGSPRGEHTTRPGTTWESWAQWLGERYVPDTATAGDPPLSETAACGGNEPQPPTPPNRATRRAMQRAARRTK